MGVSNLPQTNKRRYTVKLNTLFNRILAAVLAVTLVFAVGNGVVQASPPSGTGGFAGIFAFPAYLGSPVIVANPGQTEQVVAFFLVVPTTRTIITQIRAIRVGGDAPNSCFSNLRLAVDLDGDGIYTPGVDQQQGAAVAAPNFDGLLGAVIGAANAPNSNAPLRISTVAEIYFLVADISPTCKGGTLILGVTPVVEDIPPTLITDTFTGVAFPLNMLVQFSIGGSLTGQGESLARDITVQAVPTMVGTQTAGPGQNKIIAVYGICDGGLSMVWVPISTVFATGYVGCIPTGTEDGFPTAVSQAIVKRVSGNLNRVKLQLWLDRNGSQAPDPGEEIGPAGGLLCDFSQGDCVFGTPGNLLIDSGPGDAAGTIFPPLGGLLDPAAGTCPAGNSVFGGAAYCGATLFLTAEPLENGTLQVQTTFVASDIPRLVLTPTSGFKEQPGPSPITLSATGFGPGPGPTTATLVISSVTNPKKPAKSMTYKNVFVSATGPAGASKVITGFLVPGCTVSKVTGPVGATVVVGGAPVGPFKVKVKCATKPATVPGLTPLRVGGDDSVPSLIPLRAGSVGTVEVFTLTGKKVLETGFSGGALDVNKLGLPNGVYLYVVTVQGPDGQLVKSELKKLVVVR
jgi:hypothetical protein